MMLTREEIDLVLDVMRAEKQRMSSYDEYWDRGFCQKERAVFNDIKKIMVRLERARRLLRKDGRQDT